MSWGSKHGRGGRRPSYRRNRGPESVRKSTNPRGPGAPGKSEGIQTPKASPGNTSIPRSPGGQRYQPKRLSRAKRASQPSRVVGLPNIKFVSESKSASSRASHPRGSARGESREKFSPNWTKQEKFFRRVKNYTRDTKEQRDAKKDIGKGYTKQTDDVIFVQNVGRGAAKRNMDADRIMWAMSAFEWRNKPGWEKGQRTLDNAVQDAMYAYDSPDMPPEKAQMAFAKLGMVLSQYEESYQAYLAKEKQYDANRRRTK